MYVTLDEAKKHLNVDADFTDDDAYITSLIEVSEDSVFWKIWLTLGVICPQQSNIPYFWWWVICMPTESQ